MIYFCKSCQSCVCPDCALFSSDHKNHDFTRMEDHLQQQNNFVKTKIKILYQRMIDLTKIDKVMDKAISKLTNRKNKLLKELKHFAHDTSENLNAQWQGKIMVLSGIYTFFEQKKICF